MKSASHEARRLNADFVGTEHVLLGLIREGTGAAANVLKELNVHPGAIRSEIEKVVQEGPVMVTIGDLPLTRLATRVVEYAVKEARNLNRNYVGTEHLLLGLLREQEGLAALVLMNLHMELEKVREVVLHLPDQQSDAARERERATQATYPRPPVLKTTVPKKEEKKWRAEQICTAAMWTLLAILAVFVALDVLNGKAAVRQRALEEIAQTNFVLVCIIGCLSLSVASFCVSIRFAGPNLMLYEMGTRFRAEEMTGSGRYGVYRVNPEYFTHLKQQANVLVPQFQGKYSWLNIPATCFGAVGAIAFLALDKNSVTEKVVFTLITLIVGGLAFGVGWMLFSDQCTRFVIDSVEKARKTRRWYTSGS